MPASETYAYPWGEEAAVVDKVITLGRSVVSSAVIRGSSAGVIGGDFREIRFACRFVADAVNTAGLAPDPRIRVTIYTQAHPNSYDVEIEPPGGHSEALRSMRREGAPPSWTRRIVADENGSRAEPRLAFSAGSAVRRSAVVEPLARRSRWELDDPFGDDFGGGGDVFVPETSGRIFVRLIDPAVDESGTWTVRVHNNAEDDQTFTIIVDHPETVQILRETRIPFQLINRTFAQALLALGLRMKIDNGQARIEFGQQFAAMIGLENPTTIPVSGRIRDVNLMEFTVKMGYESGYPTIRVGLDIEDRGEEIALWGPDVDIENLAIEVKTHISFGYVLHDFFDSAPRRENNLFVRRSLNLFTFLSMNPEIDGFWADFADAILWLQGTSVSEEVQEAIGDAELALGNQIDKAATYVQDVIMHLVDRRQVLFGITADDDAIIVTHHRRPTPRDFLDENIVVTPDDMDIATTGTDTSTFRGTANSIPPGGEVVATQASGRAAAVPAPARRTAARTAPTPRIREGEIDHIVVLMMENRSFDHMLGYRAAAHPEVSGLSGNESNPYSNGPPYRVHHLTQTAGIRSPRHDHSDTLLQIDGGAMTGFVENYATRSNNPQLVMGYYDQRELPVYEFLANNYAICDRWHSAHPGATQCNRFATLTGRTPELENFELDDDRLGYYDGYSVLDYLSEIDVDWVYAEGNVAFLRMFDGYRIDIDHVIPYRDDFDQGIEDTFEERVLAGDLPSVSIIDPRYIDVPPAWDANDDLPPADVCRGQELVGHLYALLTRNRAKWAKTMLIVTYDEHGGFYDHEPPAGLPNAADPGPFPPIITDGPTHLGVRVPAFVVSPWVDGGTVFHTTFDHTSILRTILQRFAPAELDIAARFGARAAAANGLLTEQLRATARRQDPPPPPSFDCPQSVPHGPSAGIDADEFQLSVRLLGVPSKYRTRAQW